MKSLILFIFFSAISIFSFAQTTYYVNGTLADNSGAGTSWATAKKDLQNAIDIASAGDEIWVAQGTYLPTAAPDGTTSSGATDRNNAFHINKNLKIYGGFTGTESLLSERDWESNPTILSGDFNGDDVVSGSGSSLIISNTTENAYHVFITTGLNSTTLIDGLTIQGGNANGSSSISYAGNTFSRNSGGGMFNNASSPSISNSTFSGNTATNNGGGMANRFSSSPSINNTVFYGNTAPTGSDINGDPINSSSAYNASDGSGGGISSGSNFVVLSSVASTTLFVNAADPDGPDNIWRTADDGLFPTAASPLTDAGSNNLLPADTTDLDNDGNTTEVIPFDSTGAARIQGGTVDIGAYEYDPTLSITAVGEKEVFAYPVPVKDRLTIDFRTHSTGMLRLHNILGKEVLNSPVEGTQAKLQMQTLPAGVYLLYIETEDIQKRLKVIKE